MKAVIMCGGVGSRMRPITEVLPKPLLPLCGTPVLDILIRRLAENGADTIYVTLGYMAGEITRFLDAQSYPVPVVQVTEAKPLGTAGGVANALFGTKDDIVVVSGDNIFSFDLADVYRQHCESAAAVTLVGCRKSDPRDYGTVSMDGAGNILGFVEKPSWAQVESEIINTGIYFFGARVLELIPAGQFFDFANDLFPVVLAKELSFRCILAEGAWGDLGDESAYMKANVDAFRGLYGDVADAQKLVREDRLLPNGTTIYAPCVVGKNIRFGEDCQIGAYSVLGDDCILGDRVRLSECMTGSGCRLENDVDATGAYIGDSSVIGSHTEIRRGAVLAGNLTVGNYAKIASDARLWPGCHVEDMLTVSGVLQCETPQELSLTAAGVSGKAFKDLTLSHAFHIGAAAASVGFIERVGIASDGSALCDIYKDALQCGLLSCGAKVYDFGAVFRAQCHFLSQYCALDFFICVSAEDDVVNLSFLGKRGLPVDRRTERIVSAAFRYGQFQYVSPAACAESFPMLPIKAVYRSFLRHAMPAGDGTRSLAVDCENREVFELLTGMFRQKGYPIHYGGLQFILSKAADKFYAVENGRAFSYDRILTICCKHAFEQGAAVAAGEEAPGILEKIAEDTGSSFYRICEGDVAPSETAATLYCENFWVSDALFLLVKLLSVLSETGLSLAALSDALPDCFVKRMQVTYTVSPMELRHFLHREGAVRSTGRSGYFEMEDERGVVHLKPDNTGRRIKVLAESESMEISRELTTDIACKIKNCALDNLTGI